MRNQKEFYEKYWEHREKEGRLHTREGMWIPKRVKIAVDTIVKEIQFGKSTPVRVLDIGCGEGTIGKLLKEALGEKVSIIGCDISTIALKSASVYYSEVHEIDIETDELTQRLSGLKYDYIVVLEVLEHLFKPENVLKQAYNLLKPDGALISSFPNIAFYKNRIDMLKGHFPRNYLLFPGEHIQNFTLPSFKELLHENGFCPVSIDGDILYPRFFRPWRIFFPIVKRLPNLFGDQLVVTARRC